jgi:hypothetical protein
MGSGVLELAQVVPVQRRSIGGYLFSSRENAKDSLRFISLKR